MVRGYQTLLSRRFFIYTIMTSILIRFFLKKSVANTTERNIDFLIRAIIKDAVPKEGKIILNIPEIAENGASVQFTVTVESPMTEQDYVKAIHVFAEGNTTPHVASYYFTPYSGKARLTTRIRLARKQYVRVLATMSDGSAYSTRREVNVAVGGC